MLNGKEVNNKMVKKKLGIFSLTSCDGCQITFLDMDEEFLNIIKNFEVIDFALIKDLDYSKKIDIALIEGTPVNPEEIKILKKIRKIAKKVVALGTCATFGGVTAIRDFNNEEAKNASYKDASYLHLNEDVKGIGNIIEVDAYIRGCPPVKNEIKNVLESLNKEIELKEYELPVCVECRKNGNPCFLKDGVACMGSITYGGCDSICVNNKFPCYGCRGPLKTAKADSLFLVLKNKIGMSEREIKNMFMIYAGSTKRYTKIIEEGVNNES